MKVRNYDKYEEYIESLKSMRANIYKFDELITDVTAHPATRRTVEGHAKTYNSYFSTHLGNTPFPSFPEFFAQVLF